MTIRPVKYDPATRKPLYVLRGGTVDAKLVRALEREMERRGMPMTKCVIALLREALNCKAT